ncbi:hypothetical protein [Mycolicibacterium llatzerense]|uniref:hypothetical protein n=1 Tax=Mycolicibacterium llatzerense TaxID=280871 RepID=UPI0013A6BE06|nr:hypothetical protein [Mycolicibacterium llatzerense]
MTEVDLVGVRRLEAAAVFALAGANPIHLSRWLIQNGAEVEASCEEADQSGRYRRPSALRVAVDTGTELAVAQLSS